MATLRKTDREKDALRELQDLVAARYPQATFEVVRGYDPPGKYLEVSVVTDDFDETFEDILDTVMKRLLVFQDEQDLDIYVMPVLARETSRLCPRCSAALPPRR